MASSSTLSASYWKQNFTTLEFPKLRMNVEKNIPESRIQEIGARDWPKWEMKQYRQFKWQFSQTEKYYMLNGKIRAYPGPDGKHRGEFVEVNEGDLVEFPSGYQCYWTVIERPIIMHIHVDEDSPYGRICGPSPTGYISYT